MSDLQRRVMRLMPGALGPMWPCRHPQPTRPAAPSACGTGSHEATPTPEVSLIGWLDSSLDLREGLHVTECFGEDGEGLGPWPELTASFDLRLCAA